MAYLTVTFKDITLQVLTIQANEVAIGRAPDNALHIDSLAIAPHHAVLRISGEDATIHQLDPNHPLLVNDKQVSEHPLHDGDRITVGKHHILFSNDTSWSPHGASEPAPPPVPKPSGPARDATLQVLKGKNIGLIIPLRSGMTRLGKDSTSSAVIARRKEGYFLSALAESPAVRINDISLGDRSAQLNSGDIIKIGEQLFQFYCAS